MRKITNWIVGLMAAAVVVAITYITLDSSLSNIIYNSCFLAAMIVILIVGCGIGFGRMRQTQHGLDQATEKLKAISDGGGNMSAITKPGAAIFGVPYFDAKYQEYLHYLRKTNSPTDIGDYIGEYEINNYTHRRLLEMIPDILTSLGILGTFVGLVLGLRHFNPTSYEAMSGSVESLIDGIKVAFVTSIYGISLSLAFSYWLRGALTGVSESLDRFLDAYYTTAVTPTDTSLPTRMRRRRCWGRCRRISQSRCLRRSRTTSDRWSSIWTIRWTVSRRLSRFSRGSFWRIFPSESPVP